MTHLDCDVLIVGVGDEAIAGKERFAPLIAKL